MNENRAEKLLLLLSQLPHHRVLVLGDLCLDEYIIGQAQRLSREAPVPILEFERRFTVAGAAANPALNIRAQGAEALMVGVIGADPAGEALRENLRIMGVETEGVVVDPSRATTLKTRVMAEVSLHFPQQLVRVDRQERRPLAPRVKKRIMEYLAHNLDGVDAILISDYKSGVVDTNLVRFILTLAKARGLLVTVDSQGDLHKFKGATVVKCNQEEAERTLGRTLKEESHLGWALSLLKGRLQAQGFVITRGSDGMSAIDEEGRCSHIPAANRSEVFDVTGAGDTVIAVLTLALVAGASIADAAHLASYAAGLVVRKLGNVAPTRGELEKAILYYQG